MPLSKPLQDARDAVLQFKPAHAFAVAFPAQVFLAQVLLAQVLLAQVLLDHVFLDHVFLEHVFLEHVFLEHVFFALSAQLEHILHLLHEWSINRGDEHEIDAPTQGKVGSRTASTEEDVTPFPSRPGSSHGHAVQAGEEHGPYESGKDGRKTKDPADTLSQKHASYRVPKNPSPFRILIFMPIFFNVVSAHSTEFRVATYGSGFMSTLCSWIVLELPANVEGGRNMAFIISLSCISVALCLIFATGMQHMLLRGLEKHVFFMLSLLLTTLFCYIANKRLIEQGHNWLEGIPLLSMICTVFLICGIAGVREVTSRFGGGSSTHTSNGQV